MPVKDIQVDTGAEHDPEEIPAERTEPGKGIEFLAESDIENGFCAVEQNSEQAFQRGHPCATAGRFIPLVSIP
jgi:hypothetical protein